MRGASRRWPRGGRRDSSRLRVGGVFPGTTASRSAPNGRHTNRRLTRTSPDPSAPSAGSGLVACPQRTRSSREAPKQRAEVTRGANARTAVQGGPRRLRIDGRLSKRRPRLRQRRGRRRSSTRTSPDHSGRAGIGACDLPLGTPQLAPSCRGAAETADTKRPFSTTLGRDAAPLAAVGVEVLDPEAELLAVLVGGDEPAVDEVTERSQRDAEPARGSPHVECFVPHGPPR